MAKNVVLIQSASQVKKYNRKYKCPYCGNKYDRKLLAIHIQNKHEDSIPEGYTALRVAFNTINNKTEGHCIICGDVTKWNESKGRYERLCGRKYCLDTYKKMVQERTKKKYGTDRLQSDPRYAEEIQKKALAGRRISGEYTFQDGGKIQYVGSYERKLLEFMDKVMNINSEDIEGPGPAIEYKWNNELHTYISDFCYIPYNLLIEVKDGGDNPNKNPEMQQYKVERQHAKELAVQNNTSYNYIRLTNNDFGQLMVAMSILKYNMENDAVLDKRFFRVNESMIGTIGGALPIGNPFKPDNEYYVLKYSRLSGIGDCDNIYGITNNPLITTNYIIEEDGNISLKKIKNTDQYTVFKIKETDDAKDIYDDVKQSYESNTRLSKSNKDRLTKTSNLETVLSFKDRLKVLESDVYNYLNGSNSINEMYKNFNKIQSIFNEESDMDDIYKVLPEDKEFTIDDLEIWKAQFDSLSPYLKKVSNEMSVSRYGFDNITRYNELKKKILDNIDPKINITNNGDDPTVDNVVDTNVILTQNESNRFDYLYKNTLNISNFNEADLLLLYKACGFESCIHEQYGKKHLQLEELNFDNKKNQNPYSSPKLNKNPIYVILFNNNTLISNAIKFFTGSEYSHAALSLDQSLDHMYSYAGERDRNTNQIIRVGFVDENKRSYLMMDGMVKIKCYAIFLNDFYKLKIVNTIKDYISNKAKTKYNIFNILSIGLHKALSKSISNSYEMICSQFVYSILALGNINTSINKSSSLVTPGDLSKSITDSYAYTVYDDKLIDYNPNKIKKLVDKIYNEKIYKYNYEKSSVMCE